MFRTHTTRSHALQVNTCIFFYFIFELRRFSTYPIVFRIFCRTFETECALWQAVYFFLGGGTTILLFSDYKTKIKILCVITTIHVHDIHKKKKTF